MATYIEYNSTLDGKDFVAISRSRSVWSQINDILRVFKRKGYQVFGEIEYLDRDYKGEYRLVSHDEECTLSIH